MLMDYALRLLHPFMPFITEEIWQRIPHDGDSIMVQEFPSTQECAREEDADHGMQTLMDLVASLRSARAEMNIDPKKILDATIVLSGQFDPAARSDNLDKIKLLARLDTVELAAGLAAERVQLKGVWKSGEFGSTRGRHRFQANRERIRKELTRLGAEIQKVLKS